MSFGGRLSQERKRLGLTQRALADATGINAPTLSLMENNYRGLRGESLARLQRAGVDVIYVLTGRPNLQPIDGAAELLASYGDLPPPLQAQVKSFTLSMAAYSRRKKPQRIARLARSVLHAARMPDH